MANKYIVTRRNPAGGVSENVDVIFFFVLPQQFIVNGQPAAITPAVGMPDAELLVDRAIVHAAEVNALDNGLAIWEAASIPVPLRDPETGNPLTAGQRKVYLDDAWAERNVKIQLIYDKLYVNFGTREDGQAPEPFTP